MSRVVSLVNQKGGSGKTTSVLEIAYQAGIKGNKVLVVDLDPQGDATKMLLRLEPGDKPPVTVFDLMVGRHDSVGAVWAAADAWPNVLIIPSSPNLSTIEGHIGNRAAKDQLLKRALQPIRESFDLILIDLGPTTDYLTLNALIASDLYQVPLDHSTYGIGGLEAIRELAQDVIESGANPGLRFAGAHVSAHQKGGSHGVRELEADVRVALAQDLIGKVPNTSKVIEAQRRRVPLGSIDPLGRAAVSYHTICKHLLSF